MKENIYDLTSDGVLDSVFEIEDILENIAELQSKVSYYQELKKYRVKTCEDKINSLQSRMDLFRKVILNTMQKLAPEKKTIDFSPIGKVTRRKPTQSWLIDDEEELIEFLEKNGRKDEVVETKEKLVKKLLDKVLIELSAKKKEIPGVTYVDNGESVSISFEKNYSPKEKTESVKEMDVVEMSETIEI